MKKNYIFEKIGLKMFVVIFLLIESLFFKKIFKLFVCLFFFIWIKVFKIFISFIDVFSLGHLWTFGVSYLTQSHLPNHLSFLALCLSNYNDFFIILFRTNFEIIIYFYIFRKCYIFAWWFFLRWSLLHDFFLIYKPRMLKTIYFCS